MGDSRGSRGARPIALRRVLCGVACALVTLAAATGTGAWAGSPDPPAHATSALADLTGAWQQIPNPHGSPPWQLRAYNSGANLEANWAGAPGFHEHLHGEFHGTLSPGGSYYEGRYHVTEEGNESNGTARFTILNANQIKLDIGAEHITFFRLGGAPSSSSGPPATVVPPPSGWDETTPAAQLAPGAAAVNASPPLGNTLTATATEFGLSPEDVASVLLQSARAYCYLKVSHIVAAAAYKHRKEFAALRSKDELEPQLEEAALTYGFILTDCLALAEEAVAQELARTASLLNAQAAAACPITPVQIKSRRSHGKELAVGFAIISDRDVAVKCAFSAGTLTLHVASKSHKPLRKLVGPRLVIGVAHGNRGASEQVGFRYHKG